MVYLNLGCFNKIFPKPFINVDIRNDTLADVFCDVKTLECFENESVDLIYASHLFEHFDKQESQLALTNWNRVLKNGGLLRLAVPDFEAIIEYYQETKNLSSLQSFLYGSQKHEYDYHYICYDFALLKSTLEKNGFVNVARYDWQTVWPHNYIDDYSQSYLPDGCKKYIYGTDKREVNLGGKLMSLNIECLKKSI